MNDNKFVTVRDALAALVDPGAHVTIDGYCTVARGLEYDPATFPEGCCCYVEGIRCFGDTGVRMRAETLAADLLEGILAVAHRHGLRVQLAAAAGHVDVRLEPTGGGAAFPDGQRPGRGEPSANGTAAPAKPGPLAADNPAAAANALRQVLEDARHTALDRRTVVLGREQRDWIWCAAHTLADYATGALSAEDDDRRVTLMCAAELHEVVRAFDDAARPRSGRGRG